MKQLVIVLLVLFNGTLSAVHKVPIRKLTSMREKMTREGTWAEYQKQRQISKDLNTRGHADIPQKDYSDLVYVAELRIGSNSQLFQVVADTGSSSLWVPDKGCTYTVCANKDKFDSNASTTYQNDGRYFSIQYGTGSCQGFWGQDTVNFGGIISPKTTFAQATSLAPFFQYAAYDGILGLGWPQIAIDGVKPLVNIMIDQGLLDQPLFGVYFTEESTVGQIAGEMTLGGIDRSKFTGNITYTPVTRKGYWQINIDGALLNGNSIAGTGSAISDTGTSLIIGPQAAINAIVNTMNGVYDPNQGLYSVNCDNVHTLPDVVFIINGELFAVTSKSYIVKLMSFGNIKCYLGFDIINAGSLIDWIFGDVFIREWYQIYDFGNAQLGLAKSV